MTEPIPTSWLIGGLVVLAVLVFAVMYFTRSPTVVVEKYQGPPQDSRNPTQGMTPGQSARIAQPQGGQRPQGQAPQGSQNTPTLALFYSDECGHCQQLKPEFEKAAGTLKDRMRVFEIPPTHEYFRKTGITNVPMIFYYPNGIEDSKNFREYKGNRTADDIVQFAMQQ